MRIIESEIDWARGWGNSPSLIVLVDKMPKQEDILFRKHELKFDESGRFPDPNGKVMSTLYWGQVPGTPFCSFFCHTPSSPTGYGGATWTIRMEGGGPEVKVKGPWSSNSHSMNEHFPMCHEVTIKEQENPKLGYHGFSLCFWEFRSQVRKCGGDIVFSSDYGDDAQVNCDVHDAIMGSLDKDPDKPVGSFAINIVLPGRTMKESQKEKNIGWSMGRRVEEKTK